MTTNQTIDGVPRELLEPFATYVSDSPNAIMRARAKELRALLDAPANPPTCLPVSGGRGIRMSGVQRFHEAANDALVKLSKHCVPGTKMALVIYAPGEPELDIVLQDKGLSLDEVISTLRRSGLSIDGDNAYKRDLCDSIVGALAMGAQNTNPPPADHWGQRFWDIGREERELHEELVAALKITRENLRA